MKKNHRADDDEGEPASGADGNAVKFRALAVSLRNGTGREIVESIADIVDSALGNRRLLKRIEDVLARQDKSVLLLQCLWRNRATQLNDLFQLGRFMSLCAAAGTYDVWRPKLFRWLESGNAPDQVTGMVNAWLAGDVSLMQEVAASVNKGKRMTDQLDAVLLHSRHDEMLKKIVYYLEGDVPHFVAVGSLHLLGPKGLVEMLKARGYEVTQL